MDLSSGDPTSAARMYENATFVALKSWATRGITARSPRAK
jgi:hypothetical protein